MLWRVGGRARILDGRALILNSMLATQDVTVGPASADPPALALRAGGTALVNIEPEELSYSPASSSPQVFRMCIVNEIITCNNSTSKLTSRSTNKKRGSEIRQLLLLQLTELQTLTVSEHQCA